MITKLPRAASHEAPGCIHQKAILEETCAGLCPRSTNSVLPDSQTPSPDLFHAPHGGLIGKSFDDFRCREKAEMQTYRMTSHAGTILFRGFPIPESQITNTACQPHLAYEISTYGARRGVL